VCEAKRDLNAGDLEILTVATSDFQMRANVEYEKYERGVQKLNDAC
jgi:hypothetical protein